MWGARSRRWERDSVGGDHSGRRRWQRDLL